MSRLINLLYPKSSDGWQVSESGKEIIDELFNENFSKPSFKTLSLLVKEECQVELVLGDKGVKEVLTLLPETSLELDMRFQYLYSFKFITPNINYYFLASY